MYALDNITVIDNFLDELSHSKLLELVKSSSLNWIRTGILPEEYFKDDEMYNFQMISVIYDDYNPPSKNPGTTSEYIKFFIPLIHKIKPDVLIRMKVNMTFNWGKQIFNGYHIDEPTRKGKGMTAIYYINSNDGYTQFERGDIVDSVSNRIVIFPNEMCHSGVTSTDSSGRFVININWIDNRINRV